MPKLSLSPRRREILISAALLTAAAALAALLAARSPLGTDYIGAARTHCDCPGASIRALAHGRLHDFFALQPVMGSFSLLVRAPFAALGLLFGHGSNLDLYRLGAFPCLLATGLLAAHLFHRMHGELRRPLLACALVAGLVAVNPLTTRALRYGHPEEVLAAALCVAAVLAAARRRPVLAGALLAAAFATKQWALLAALPVLLAAPERRGRLALAAAAGAALLVVPMALTEPHRFVGVNQSAGVSGLGALPTNVWFGFGTDVPVVLGPHGATSAPRVIPAALGAVSHPLILVAGLALALLWWRRRGDAAPEDALLLLALVMLVRCLLDPLTNSYYHLPFLTSLAAWEGLRRGGAPVLTVSAVVLLSFTSALAGGGVLLTKVNAFYLLWTLPFAGVLAALAFRPRPAPAAVPTSA